MNVEKAIMKRRSTRSYKDKEIPKDKLGRIMNVVRLAPSARNRQEWRFVVVTDDKTKEELYEVSMKQNQVRQASAVIVGVDTDPNYNMTNTIPGGPVDVAIALDHLSLKATEEGFGTCWIGAFEQEKVKELLNIPKQYQIISMMTIGYPKDPLKEIDKNRDSFDKVVSYNTFEE